MEALELNKTLAREDFNRLLAACYYQPEEHLDEEDVFGSLVRAAEQIDSALADGARRLADGFAAETLQDLLLDYTRLFLGPTGILAKPYGSVWLEGEKVVMGDSTMAVLELYREGGFDLDANFREVPDHIAAELEFLYLLNFQENEARRDGNVEGLAKAADLKRRFLTSHLGCWVAPFAEAMKNGADSAFYKTLAELTVMFVNAEMREGKE
jgi:TorA maturation chaperone TorD